MKITHLSLAAMNVRDITRDSQWWTQFAWLKSDRLLLQRHYIQICRQASHANVYRAALAVSGAHN